METLLSTTSEEVNPTPISSRILPDKPGEEFSRRLHTEAYNPDPSVPDLNFGGAYLLIHTLAKLGVREVFGLPGGAIAEFTTALERYKKIRFLLARHEQGAGFMAYGAAKAAKKVAVVVATQGPGACNLVNVAASATEDRVPLVVLTGNVSLASGFRRAFQNIDTQKLFEPVTKWSVTIKDVKSIPDIISEAFRCASSWPYGAVHVEIPKSISNMKIDPREYESLTVLRSPRTPRPNESDLRDVWKEITLSRAPIIIVGPEIWSNETKNLGRDELRKFCDLTNIGVVMMPGGKGAVLPDKAYCLFTLSVIFADFPNLAISSADLVISIGYDRAECDTAAWSSPNLADRIIHISPSVPVYEKLYKPKIEVIGNVGIVMKSLNEFIAGNEGGVGKVPRWSIPTQESAREQMLKSFRVRTSVDTHSWLYQERICFDIQHLSDELRTKSQKMCLVLDSGGSQLWMLRNWQCHSGSEVLSSNAFASMGIGLPMAIGAAHEYKLARKSHRRKVVCLFGDGGWIMNMQEMETAKRLDVDLVVIVWINNSLGLVEWGDQTDFGDKMSFDFSNPSVERLAPAFGWTGIDVKSSAEFLPAIRDAVERGGRTMVYVYSYPEGDLDLSDQLVRNCVLGENVDFEEKTAPPSEPKRSTPRTALSSAGQM